MSRDLFNTSILLTATSSMISCTTTVTVATFTVFSEHYILSHIIMQLQFNTAKHNKGKTDNTDLLEKRNYGVVCPEMIQST